MPVYSDEEATKIGSPEKFADDDSRTSSTRRSLILAQILDGQIEPESKLEEMYTKSEDPSYDQSNSLTSRTWSNNGDEDDNSKLEGENLRNSYDINLIDNPKGKTFGAVDDLLRRATNEWRDAGAQIDEVDSTIEQLRAWQASRAKIIEQLYSDEESSLAKSGYDSTDFSTDLSQQRGPEVETDLSFQEKDGDPSRSGELSLKHEAVLLASQRALASLESVMTTPRASVRPDEADGADGADGTDRHMKEKLHGQHKDLAVLEGKQAAYDGRGFSEDGGSASTRARFREIESQARSSAAEGRYETEQRLLHESRHVETELSMLEEKFRSFDSDLDRLLGKSTDNDDVL